VLFSIFRKKAKLGKFRQVKVKLVIFQKTV